MTIDDLLKFAGLVLGICNFVSNGAMFVYMRRNDRHKEIDQQLAKGAATVVEVQQRVERIETEIKNAPTHGDLSRIYDRINQISGSVGEIKGGVDEVKIGFRQLMSSIINKGTQ